jgi:hypothetical protein
MFQKVSKSLKLSSTAPHGLYCVQGADPVDKNSMHAIWLSFPGQMGKACRPSPLYSKTILVVAHSHVFSIFTSSTLANI